MYLRTTEPASEKKEYGKALPCKLWYGRIDYQLIFEKERFFKTKVVVGGEILHQIIKCNCSKIILFLSALIANSMIFSLYVLKENKNNVVV